MGFFSWKCAKSGESIANSHANKPSEQSDCYLVTPTVTYHEPSYEGYGEFAGEDVYALLGDGNRDIGIDRTYSMPPTTPFKIKVVLAKYYNGESYDELSESEECPNQGYFYGDDE